MERGAALLETHIVASPKHLAVSTDERSPNRDAAFVAAFLGFFQGGLEAGI